MSAAGLFSLNDLAEFGSSLAREDSDLSAPRTMTTNDVHPSLSREGSAQWSRPKTGNSTDEEIYKSSSRSEDETSSECYQAQSSDVICVASSLDSSSMVYPTLPEACSSRRNSASQPSSLPEASSPVDEECFIIIKQAIIDPAYTTSYLEDLQKGMPEDGPAVAPISTFKFNIEASDFVPSRPRPSRRVDTKRAGDSSLKPPSKKASSRGASSRGGGRGSSRRAKMIPITVPLPDAFKVLDRMKELVDMRADCIKPDHIENPPKCIKDTAIYTIRVGITELVTLYYPKEEDGTRPVIDPTCWPMDIKTSQKREGEGKRKSKRSRGGTSSRRSRARSERAARTPLGMIPPEEDSDPFNMEVLKLAMNLGTTVEVTPIKSRPGALGGTANKGTSPRTTDSTLAPSSAGKSPWSLKTQVEGDDVEAKIEAFARKVRSCFNKLNTGNWTRIVYERLMPLVAEFIYHKDVISTDAYHIIINALLVSVANSKVAKNQLLAQATFDLLLFVSKVEDDGIPDCFPKDMTPKWKKIDCGGDDLAMINFQAADDSPLKPILIKTLQKAIETHLQKLNPTFVLANPLEVINEVKDSLKGLMEFAWNLAIRGVLPNSVLRSLMDRLCDDVESSCTILNIEKLVMLMNTASYTILSLGGIAFEKCFEAWRINYEKLNRMMSSVDWEGVCRGEASRLTVLLEIALAEISLRPVYLDLPHSYPVRLREIKKSISNFATTDWRGNTVVEGPSPKDALANYVEELN